MTKEKNLWMNIKSFISNHKLFTIIVVLELLVVTAFGWFLATRQEISTAIPLDISTEAEKKAEDGSTDKTESFEIGNIGLHLGGYETEVEYEFTPEEQSNNVVEAGRVVFVNTQNDKTVEGGDLFITNLTTKEKGRLYIGHGQNIRIDVRSQKNGTLRIYNFILKENIGYRFTLFFGLVIAVTLFDIVYLFFASKKISSKTKKIFGAIALITILSSLPYFMNVLFGGHDIDFHLERIAALSSEISNGDVPSRMMTDMMNGHMYPNSIFYCDIFLYIPALLYSMFIPLQTCYQIYCILISLVTCVIAYCCFKKITKNTKVSLVGSALYTLSTYRLIDMALRAAIGELTAMAFLPLIILGLYNIYTAKKPTFRDWAPLGIGFALIIMSHIITLELSLGFIVIFCLVMFKKTFKKDRILSLIKAALLCVGISLWFVLPFADYTLNQPVDVMDRGANGFYSQSGAYPVQYLNPFDTASNKGDLDVVVSGMQNEMSFGIGISILAGLVLVGWILICNHNNRKIDKIKYKTIIILVAIGCAALLLGSYLFPWGALMALLPSKAAGIVASIQYPWRFISIATVAFVFAVVTAMSCVEQTKISKYLNHICFALVALAVISSTQYLFSVPHTKQNYVFNYAPTKSSLWVGAGEYLPSGAQLEDNHENKIRVIKGELEDTDYRKEGDEYILSFNNQKDEDAEVVLPIFAYRYVEATKKSGEKIDITVSNEKKIMINLPSHSDGEIAIRFSTPFFWHIAEIISVGSVAYCIFMYIHTRGSRTRHKQEE